MRFSTIESIRKRHPDEWLLIDVRELDEETTTPLKGRLLAHSRSRDEIWRKSRKIKAKLKMVTHAREDLPTVGGYLSFSSAGIDSRRFIGT